MLFFIVKDLNNTRNKKNSLSMASVFLYHIEAVIHICSDRVPSWNGPSYFFFFPNMPPDLVTSSPIAAAYSRRASFCLEFNPFGTTTFTETN